MRVVLVSLSASLVCPRFDVRLCFVFLVACFAPALLAVCVSGALAELLSGLYLSTHATLLFRDDIVASFLVLGGSLCVVFLVACFAMACLAVCASGAVAKLIGGLCLSAFTTPLFRDDLIAVS